MELDLIEYLESKNFEIEEIMRFQKKYINKDDKKIIKKMNDIYKIFGYVNITESDVNALILNNIKILDLSDLDILKVSFVWGKTGVLYEACNRQSRLNYNNILRTYLRYIYLNSGKVFNKSPISYNALRMGENEFQNDYQGNINNMSFYPTFENLINVYGKGQNLEEKKEYLEKILLYQTLSWYRDITKKEKEKNNDSRSL